MVYRMQLTYNEIVDILDVKYIAGSTIGYTLPPGVYEITDNNLMLKSLLPKGVKGNFTVVDIRLKSNLTTNKTIRFTRNFFFYKSLIFPKSHLVEVGDIDGFVKLITGTYESERPINITRNYKTHLKCDCFNGSIVNGVRERILYSFALSSPPSHKIYKDPTIKFLKKKNKSVLFHITFYLEDDDHKPLDFNGKTISFTCQLIKI